MKKTTINEKHTVTVETEIVCSSDCKYTYEVIKRFPGVDGQKGIMVSLYPTRTKDNLYADDTTLNHVVGHMQDMGLSELHMVNLFAQVAEGKIKASELTVDNENLKYLENIIGAPDFKEYVFIIAWGNSLATSYPCLKSKYEVYKLLKKYVTKPFAYQINLEDHDIGVDFAHPLYLGIRGGRFRWTLEKKGVTEDLFPDPDLSKSKE